MVFFVRTSRALGLLLALRSLGLVGNIRLVGFDANERLVTALEQGALEGLVVQSPVEMGYLGVKTAVDHLQGVTVELRQNTGVTLATHENMKDPIIAELLTPDLSRLLDR